MNGYALFLDAVIRKAEDEITQYESAKRTPQAGRGGRGGSPVGRRSCSKMGTSLTQPGGIARKVLEHLVKMKRTCWPGKALGVAADLRVGAEVVSLDAVPEAPKTTHSINDNYCVIDPVSECSGRCKRQKHFCQCSSKCV